VVINPFEGTRIVLVPEQKVTVLPLPESGKPEHFSGIVGQFTLHSSIDKTVAKQDTPITLKITIKGYGNLSPLKELWVPESSLFKAYVARITDLNSVGNQQAKQIEYMIIPRVPGTVVIPEFLFHFFDPSAKRYQTLRTRSVTLDVSPKQGQDSPDQTPVWKDDIRYLKPIKSAYHPYFWHSIFYKGVTLLLVLWGLTLGGYRFRSCFKIPIFLLHWKQRYRDFQHIEEIRQNPNPDALHRLQIIFLKNLSKAIHQACQGKTKDDLVNLLRQSTLSDNQVNQISNILDDLAFAVYAPTQVSLTDSQALCNRCIRLLKEIV
jgi:hypothetical protein